jgi:uncharacterized protein (DUF2147 family)
MTNLLRNVFGLGAAALMTLTPIAAMAADESLGMYQTTDRKMDYTLTQCGGDLCVMLSAARGSADTGRVHPFIGKYVVDHAKPAGKNKWKGKMNIAGYEVNGTLTLDPGKKFVMSGCAYVVVCQDFTLIPAK